MEDTFAYQRVILSRADVIVEISSNGQSLIERCTELHQALCEMFAYVDSLIGKNSIISPPSFALTSDGHIKLAWCAPRVVAGHLCDSLPRASEADLSEGEMATEEVDILASKLRNDMQQWIQCVSNQITNSETACSPLVAENEETSFTLKELKKTYHITKDQARHWCESGCEFLRREPDKTRGYLVRTKHPKAVALVRKK